MRELSFRSLFLGTALSAVLAAANAYLGLFAGMTVSAAIPASVLALAILRPLGGGLLEQNLVQTGASAGEAVAAGAIFTLPALYMLGLGESLDYLRTTLLLLAGGILGVLFTIPLRRALVFSKLPFPEGVATAELLLQAQKLGPAASSAAPSLASSAAPSLASAPAVATGGAQRAQEGARLLLVSAVLSALVKFAESSLSLVGSSWQFALQLGGRAWLLGTSLSPALLGVGAIIGLPTATVILLGGLSQFGILVPLFSPTSSDPAAQALLTYREHTRFVGVGAMSLGGLLSLLKLLPTLGAAFRQLLNSALEREDLSKLSLALLLLVCSLGLLGAYASFTWSWGLACLLLALSLLTGFLFCAVAASLAGLVGSSNNPVSGVTIATVLLTSGLLLFLGYDGQAGHRGGPQAALLIGTVICTAAAIGGDTIQDLKAGALLGASPRAQQIAQLLGVGSGALVLMPVLRLLEQTHGFGPKTSLHPAALPAPQASLFAALSRGVFGGQLPGFYLGLGAVLVLALFAVDALLEAQGRTFRLPPLAFAVGLYLPLELTLPLFLGGLLGRARKASAGSLVLLLGAGLVTGEALGGLFSGLLRGLGWQRDLSAGLGGWPLGLGLLVWAGTGLVLRRSARREEALN